jgi:hypothetical protein
MQKKEHFDYAVMTFVIHEIDEAERITLLEEMATVADKIIIGEYLVPRPVNFKGRQSQLIEFLAGSEHYRNFKSFVATGGIPYLAKNAGLVIEKEIINEQTANHIAVLSK